MMENNNVNEKNDLQIFTSEQFGQVRIMTINGEDHFNLYDIGMGLGYTTKAKGKLYPRKEEISNLCKRLDIKGFSLGENFINIEKLLILKIHMLQKMLFMIYVLKVMLKTHAHLENG